ncbi:NADP-dependent malic enzyme-like [Ylistrum balloti]|uniref:NADP-dependent malic enzyme-like n=1 Tax=Ylistrum balloti TaxID=509963 RepID=UPI0029058A2D|nr:NADP-dependent malic enzyme-like [Ylistrum balloti]
MSSKKNTLEAAQSYHAEGRPGKIEVVATKPCTTQRDLSLAYTPGVADVCLDIEKEVDKAFDYTARGNLVAVISNGTAVLGLGDIGPLASKPVMEGKAVLFKRFADVDVFDIEVKEKDPQRLIEIIAALEPTFGGINLEDIKAPECFDIEDALIERLDIPVFHDDQHGTAIISAAALINALEIAGKDITAINKMVVSGAGAASVACVKLFMELGLPKEAVWMYDSRGLIHTDRSDLNRHKQEFARSGDNMKFVDAFQDADIFVGVSIGGTVTKDMIQAMASNPIVFAMANPDPEIPYPDAKAVRDDIIMATGRSDFPNQVNNVLGFPFIFRGALDVRARRINTEMKLAAAHALANLAKQTVPENVVRAYGGKSISFGRDYIIPKPFDHRVLLWVAPAVAKAAIDSGVARQTITDFDQYRTRLEGMLGPARELIRTSINRSRRRETMPRVVFADGGETNVLIAVEQAVQEGFIRPILLGNKARIEQNIKKLDLKIKGLEIIHPDEDGRFQTFIDHYWQRKQRQGITKDRATKQLSRRSHFGAMLVSQGEADIYVAGYTDRYSESLRIAEDIIGLRAGVQRPAAVTAVVYKSRLFLFADTAVSVDPTAEELVNIAKFAVEPAPLFDMTPRVAFLSFANFGAYDHPQVDKVRRAVEQLEAEGVDFIFDGEMTVDVALDQTLRESVFPFSKLETNANVLIFPNLAAAQMATQLLTKIGGAEMLGPVHRGFNRTVVMLSAGMGPTDIHNLIAMAAGQQAIQS